MEEIQKEIDKLYYWDAYILKLETTAFGDKVELVYHDSDEEGVKYIFKECYDVKLEHDITYTKDLDYEKLKLGQIPYYIQNVKVEKQEREGKELYQFEIDAWPMKAQILCRKFDASIVSVKELLNKFEK